MRLHRHIHGTVTVNVANVRQGNSRNTAIHRNVTVLSRAKTETVTDSNVPRQVLSVRQETAVPITATMLVLMTIVRPTAAMILAAAMTVTVTTVMYAPAVRHRAIVRTAVRTGHLSRADKMVKANGRNSLTGHKAVKETTTARGKMTVTPKTIVTARMPVVPRLS